MNPSAEPSTTPPVTARWTPVGPLAALSRSSMKTFKKDRSQIVLGLDESGDVFALDNRCPHEGYPLAQGDLKGYALTCCWHNWKFDVRDGKCLIGGEGVRRYETRVVQDQVEVDLADPDPAELIPPLLESLNEGLGRHENGRAIRDGVRLIEAGFEPWKLLAHITGYDGIHAEYGSTHTLALAADTGRLLEHHPGVSAMHVIGPVIDMCGDANRRLPPRMRPDPIPGATEDRLRQAVEAEDYDLAEGLLLGAFDAKVDRKTIDHWLYTVLSDHFTDFGHSLIYLTKAQELLDHVGDVHARDIYSGMLHKILLGTREDTLPYMRGYFERLRRVEGDLGDVYARAQEETADLAPLIAAVLDGTIDEAFDSVWNSLLAGIAPSSIAEALVIAGSTRLYRFSVDVDRDPSLAENWLWATHRFTFASAVRNAIDRFHSKDALRFLIQAVAFVHSGRRMDQPSEDRAVIDPAAHPTVEGIVQAITSKNAECALAQALGFLRSNQPIDELGRALENLSFGDSLVRPIFHAHAVKVTAAALEEHAALGTQQDREQPILAAVRFLATSFQERRLQENVATAIAWVSEGTIPRKVTQ